MPSVLVPDFTGPFVGDHARSDRGVRCALLAEERATVRRGDPGHDVPADAALRERRGGVLPQPAHVDVEAAPRIEMSELVAQPEIPIGMWAIPRQLPPTVRKTRQSCAWALRLPSAVTQRGNMFSTVMVPSRMSSSSFTSPARISSGSKPATTTGIR